MWAFDPQKTYRWYKMKLNKAEKGKMEQNLWFQHTAKLDLEISLHLPSAFCQLLRTSLSLYFSFLRFVAKAILILSLAYNNI